MLNTKRSGGPRMKTRHNPVSGVYGVRKVIAAAPPAAARLLRPAVHPQALQAAPPALPAPVGKKWWVISNPGAATPMPLITADSRILFTHSYRSPMLTVLYKPCQTLVS